MQNLPVVFAVDRAGIVGADGETHQGMFDLSYLTTIPNLTVMAPKNKWELSDMMKYAVALGKPCAIRYPRGEAWDGLEECRAQIETGRVEEIAPDGDILLLAVGSMVKTAVQVRALLAERGIACALTNARFIKPLDEAYLKKAGARYRMIVTMEENILAGGFGEQALRFLSEEELPARVLNLGLPDRFIEHGKPDDLLEKCGLDAKSVAARIADA